VGVKPANLTAGSLFRFANGPKKKNYVFLAVNEKQGGGEHPFCKLRKAPDWEREKRSQGKKGSVDEGVK